MFPKVILQDLKRFPIRKSTVEEQLPLIVKTDIMLSKNKELQELKQSLLQPLEAKYQGLTTSKKLADWPTLFFKEFLKELEKQKFRLSLSKQGMAAAFRSEKGQSSLTPITDQSKQIRKLMKWFTSFID
jgi:hypothetical protein